MVHMGTNFGIYPRNLSWTGCRLTSLFKEGDQDGCPLLPRGLASIEGECVICSLKFGAGVSDKIQTAVKTKRPYFPCRATHFDSKTPLPTSLPYSHLVGVYTVPSEEHPLTESHSACSETPPAKTTYIHPAMKDNPGNRHQPTRSWSMKKGRALGLLFEARKITLIRDHITPKYHTAWKAGQELNHRKEYSQGGG